MENGRIRFQGAIEQLREEDLRVIADPANTNTLRTSPIDNEDTVSFTNKKERHKSPRKLIEDEHRQVGGMKWSVYKTYLKAS